MPFHGELSTKELIFYFLARAAPIVAVIIVFAAISNFKVDVVGGIEELANQGVTPSTSYVENITDSITGEPFMKIKKLTGEPRKLFCNLKYEDWVKLDDKGKNYFVEMAIAYEDMPKYRLASMKSIRKK
jgi:hypothetical protein